MPVAEDLYGIAYLDVESFRDGAALFGVGMAMCDYANDADGNAKLARVLQAASRAVDAFCSRSFTPENRTEQHALDLKSWTFTVNNPPVAEIVSCVLRYSVDGTIDIPPANVFINNQKKYCEIARRLGEAYSVLDAIGSDLNEPQIEVVYKSLQTIPVHVALATGYQAGHLINSGFVDKTLPPNFGKLDMNGISVNNKKGYRSSEEMSAGSLSPDAERLLRQEIRFSAA